MFVFFSMFFGWILFTAGVLTVATEIVDYVKQLPEKWHKGRWWSLVSLASCAGCFTGWQLLVF